MVKRPLLIALVLGAVTGGLIGGTASTVLIMSIQAHRAIEALEALDGPQVTIEKIEIVSDDTPGVDI
jgi:hypothetical protein